MADPDEDPRQASHPGGRDLIVIARTVVNEPLLHRRLVPILSKRHQHKQDDEKEHARVRLGEAILAPDSVC